MINREGSPLDIPVDVFVHQVSQTFFPSATNCVFPFFCDQNRFAYGRPVSEWLLAEELGAGSGFSITCALRFKAREFFRNTVI